MNIDDTTSLIVGALVGVIGIFFGRLYWQVLKDLITRQAEEIQRLQDLTVVLRDRIDTLDDSSHKKSLIIQEAMGKIDDYVGVAQRLRIELRKCQQDLNKLKDRRQKHHNEDGNELEYVDIYPADH